MRRFGTLLLALALVAALPRPARADGTIFLGPNVTPSNRLTKGFAVELGILFVGFEFEYAVTDSDPSSNAPSLKTGMGNLLLQTPFPIFRFQPYFTTGVGMYNESLGTHDETGFGANTGGGVKIGLVGPLRLRIDYRVFNLGSGALNSPAHRIYTGLNLAF
jgi:hypothetical protein